MAETEQLIIQISAETVELVRSLATAKNQLDQFGKDGVFSIESLNKALKALQKQYEKTTDPFQKQNIVNAVVNIKSKIEELKASYKSLTLTEKELIDANEKLDKSKRKLRDGLNSIDDPARRARISLLAVNNVVRDLPFGFIAISNNLPILFDQFGLLVKESGSVRNAFREFAAGLVGAGGISIALSAVVTLITSAVQKYGSLSGAINALTNSQYDWFDALEASTESLSKFLKSQKDVTSIIQESSSSIEGEIALVRALINVINDETTSNEKKAGAKRKLAEINKEIFGDLVKEKDALVDLNAAANQYINTLIAQSIIKAFQEEIGKTAVELNRQKRAFDELGKAAEQSNKRLEDTRKLSQSINVIPGAAQGVGTLTTTPLQNNLKALNTETTAATEAFTKQGDVVKGLARDLIALKDQLNNTVNQFAEVLGGTTNSSDGLDKNGKSAKNNKKAQDDLAKALERQNEQWEKLQRNFAKLTFPLDVDQEIDRQFKKENPEPVEIPVRPYIKLDLIKAQLRQEEIDKVLNATKKQTEVLRQDVTSLFNQTIGPAIDGVFNALLSGENVLERLGDVFKRLTADIAATIIKTLVLKAILTAINPGAGLGALLSGGASGLASNIFNAFGGARTAALGGAPTLSGPGGIALSGEVVFVQRGTDLVGVLNRGNARIGRVG